MPDHRAQSFKLWESNQFGARVPEQIDLSDEEREILRDIKWTDLYWSEIGGASETLVWLEMSLPLDLDISKGIAVDIQLVRGGFYQVHISFAERLRGIGLGTKIYRSLVESMGHLYTDRDRLQNQIISKVWDGLKSDYGIEHASDEEGEICISRKNPDLDKLLNIFNQA